MTHSYKMTTIGLPTCCSCARYLSPTRWDVWLSSRSISHHPRQYIQNQNHSRGSSMGFSKKTSPTSKGLEAFQDLKDGIKAWAKAKRPTFDVDSVVRVVGALNVDLPKSFPDYRKLLPKWRKQEEETVQQQKPAMDQNIAAHRLSKESGGNKKIVTVTPETISQKENSKEIIDKDSVEEIANYKLEDFEVFRQKRKELLEKTDSRTTILREQHDLEQALHYYSSISFPDMSDQAEPKSKAQPKTEKILPSSQVTSYTDTVTKYIPQVILDKVMPTTVNATESSPPNENQKVC